MKNIKTFEGFFSKLMGKDDVISDCQKMIVGPDESGIASVDVAKGEVVFRDKGNTMFPRTTYLKKDIVYLNPKDYKEGDEVRRYAPRKDYNETVGLPVLPRETETQGDGTGRTSKGAGKRILLIPGGEILKKWLEANAKILKK
jgi:hypothetical protein